MLEICKLPDGSFVFKGKGIIFRTPPAINPNDIIQENFEVEAKKENIEPAVELIEEYIRGFPFKKDHLTDFAIAVSEVLQNAILHGSEKTERKVGITIIYIPKVMLYVFIMDDLGPLPVEKIRFDMMDEECKPYLGPCHRGFFIATSLSSLVAYYPDDNSKLKEIILGLEPE